jgi:hypothetical protein
MKNLGETSRSGQLNKARALTEVVRDGDGARAEILCHVAAARADHGNGDADAAFAEAADAIRPGMTNESSLKEDLVEALAGSGRIAAALVKFEPLGLDKFVEGIAKWAPPVEHRWPGTAIPMVRAAVEVAGWVRSDWAAVATMIAEGVDQ